MLLFKLRALTLCVKIFWYFSFFQSANQNNVVCLEEHEYEFKELANESGVCLIFGSLNMKERWVRSAETRGDPAWLRSCSSSAQQEGTPCGNPSAAHVLLLISPTESRIETWSAVLT